MDYLAWLALVGNMGADVSNQLMAAFQFFQQHDGSVRANGFGRKIGRYFCISSIKSSRLPAHSWV
jgi:hypothetical protein